MQDLVAASLKVYGLPAVGYFGLELYRRMIVIKTELLTIHNINDLDARPAPRPDLGPICHVCPLETIRCLPCEETADLSFLLSTALALPARTIGYLRPPHFEHFAVTRATRCTCHSSAPLRYPSTCRPLPHQILLLPPCPHRQRASEDRSGG